MARPGSAGDSPPPAHRRPAGPTAAALRDRRRRRRRFHAGRHLHRRLVHRRPALLRRGSIVALAAVIGPGVLAGLSDDDPAGITTYSILGARYGYELLWVLAISTVALILFHQLAARMGVVTGEGLVALVRRRHGGGVAGATMAVLIPANLGTLCAEFAGIAAGMELLTGLSRYVSVPVAAVGVSLVVLRGSFHRVEHVLLLLSSVFVTYLVSGVLAHPDWGAAARGLVIPSIPLTRDAVLVAVATLGTTLAPWGLAFIQSYAADKRLTVEDLRYERIDVAVGAIMTGIIGAFIVVACAATLHVRGIDIHEARDAAVALEPLAGAAAATLFGLGFVGAALLAAAVVPLSTAYSVCEAFDAPADLDDPFRTAPLFYSSFGVLAAVAAALVLVPGAPLVPILFLSQALNAVLLLPLLPLMRALARDPVVMGEHAIGRGDSVASAVAIAVIAVSVVLLGALSLA